MPYQQYDFDNLPENLDQPIWRYMDLAKFLDILVRRVQWFACVEELAKDDPYEAAFPTKNLQLATERLRRQFPPTVNILLDKNLLASQRATRLWHHNFRKATYATCWYMNPDNEESAAMWAQYAKQDGIAIRTTIRSLIDSFANEPRNVCISPIDYINYDTAPIDGTRTHLQKRRSFIHEHELRAYCIDDDVLTSFLGANISDDIANMPEGPSKFEALYHLHEKAKIAQAKYVTGIRIQTDPKVLIKEVRLAPTSQGFLEKVVEDVLDKYKLTEVIPPPMKSTIKDLPT